MSIFCVIAVTTAKPNMDETDLSAIQILIAEDNTLNQKVVKKVLDSINCNK
jgi:hypothetical protein